MKPPRAIRRSMEKVAKMRTMLANAIRLGTNQKLVRRLSKVTRGRSISNLTFIYRRVAEPPVASGSRSVQRILTAAVPPERMRCCAACFVQLSEWCPLERTRTFETPSEF